MKREIDASPSPLYYAPRLFPPRATGPVLDDDVIAILLISTADEKKDDLDDDENKKRTDEADDTRHETARQETHTLCYDDSSQHISNELDP
jgi:hypothetical protein